MKWLRGTAIVESTLVMSVTLLLLFGTITIGIAGYQQLSVDSAAYYAAHAYATNLELPSQNSIESGSDVNTAQVAANSVVAAIFPYLQLPTFLNVNIPNGGVGNTIDASSYFTKTLRHGGITLAIPEARQAEIQATTSGIFHTSTITNAGGASLEPDVNTINPDLDVASNSSYAPGATANIYFGTGMDLPPYFFAHNYYGYCTAMLWTGVCDENFTFLAFGSAEYLDSTNWGNADPTIAGTDNVFSAMLCHQRVYAYAATYLFGSTTRPVYTPGVTTQYEESYTLPTSSAWKGHPASVIYNWDYRLPWGYTPPASATPGNVQTTPLAGCNDVIF